MYHGRHHSIHFAYFSVVVVKLVRVSDIEIGEEMRNIVSAGRRLVVAGTCLVLFPASGVIFCVIRVMLIPLLDQLRMI